MQELGNLKIGAAPGGASIPAGATPVPPPTPVNVSPTGQVTDTAANAGTGTRPRPPRSEPSPGWEAAKTTVQALAEGIARNPIPVDATKVPEELGRTLDALGDHADRARKLGLDPDDIYSGRRQLKGQIQEMKEGGGGFFGRLYRWLFH